MTKKFTGSKAVNRCIGKLLKRFWPPTSEAPILIFSSIVQSHSIFAILCKTADFCPLKKYSGRDILNINNAKKKESTRFSPDRESVPWAGSMLADGFRRSSLWSGAAEPIVSRRRRKAPLQAAKVFEDSKIRVVPRRSFAFVPFS